MRKWYKGDTHNHTVNSDGKLRLYELIAKCKQSGLDWIIVTDHNYDTVPESYSSDGLTVIKGQEITVRTGHVNVWGVKVQGEPPYELPDEASYAQIMQRCMDAGATVCLNHPFCSQCGFRIPIDNLPAHCVEVWNTIQHSDNVANMNWWVSQLLKGRHLAAVGGSDYHSDVAKLDLIAMPTTIVHAESNRPDDILQALREGRSVITNKPNTSMIDLWVGDAELGDTVPLCAGLTGSVKVTKLLPGFTLRVFNNESLVYEHRAKKYEKTHEAVFPIREAGFVRAEIDVRLSGPIRSVFGWAERTFLSGRGVESKPTAEELFWAFTNPIWIAQTEENDA